VANLLNNKFIENAQVSKGATSRTIDLDVYWIMKIKQIMRILMHNPPSNVFLPAGLW